jgi:hypothetical protein
MTDPHTSMSLAAILVLTVVVLVLLVGWLAVVFLAAREPGGGSARPGSGDPARARRPEAVPRRGDMPAGAHAAPPDGQLAAGGGTGEPTARGVVPAG